MDVWGSTAAKIAELVAAVPGIQRVESGYVRDDDRDNWEVSVTELTPEVQGFFRFQLDSLRHEPFGIFSMTQFYKYAVFYGELAVFVPKDESSTLTLAWEFGNKVLEAISNQLSYTGLAAPQNVEMTQIGISVVEEGGICRFRFGTPGSGGMQFVWAATN